MLVLFVCGVYVGGMCFCFCFVLCEVGRFVGGGL